MGYSLVRSKRKNVTVFTEARGKLEEKCDDDEHLAGEATF